MNLQIVTITGADDQTPIKDLIALSHRFPFVEWGILDSLRRRGTARYPGSDWMLDFAHEMPGSAKVAYHVCGQLARSACIDGATRWMSAAMIGRMDRWQLNVRPMPQDATEPALCAAVRAMGSKPIILPLPDCARVYDEGWDVPGVVPFYDASGGRGAMADEWPRAEFIDMTPGEHGEGVEIPTLHGYAGGLTPANVGAELSWIAAAAGRNPFWIDVESGVRTDDDRFDVGKVADFLLKCSRNIQGA